MNEDSIATLNVDMSMPEIRMNLNKYRMGKDKTHNRTNDRMNESQDRLSAVCCILGDVG